MLIRNLGLYPTLLAKYFMNDILINKNMNWHKILCEYFSKNNFKIDNYKNPKELK